MRKESWKTWGLRQALNCYPMFFGTGGRALFISGDWRHAVVRLKLNLWTRNYVGTIFGGSMFAAIDPFHVVLLINALGKGYVVWDKAATINFRQPGKDVLRAEITFDDEELDEIRRQVADNGKHVFVKSVDWLDKDGRVVSTIEKTLYVASKEHFKNRKPSSGLAQA